MQDKAEDLKTIVKNLGNRIFDTLAQSFPVACGSDEFYYFPHIQLSDIDWNIWDRFSSDTVMSIVSKLSVWEDELNQLAVRPSDQNTQIDISLLHKFIRTLREQLSEVRTWESQPTFYLTLTCIGLAEALQSENQAAIKDRAGSLPEFLNQAAENLNQVPQLFCDLGLEMVADTRDYLLLLKRTVPGLDDTLIALDRFKDRLQKITTREDFKLPDDLLERIFHSHIDSEMNIQNIIHLLDREINEMEQILSRESKIIISDQSTDLPFDRLLSEALARIPSPPGARIGLVDLYKNEVIGLCEHCLEHELVLPGLVSSSPVQVAPMPSYLSAIRTASSYSISPKYPISGGNFYILNTSLASNDPQQSNHREYQMLSAHETYPGHHLLDSSRSRLRRSVRRYIEQPLFYEGWACFAEEMMKITGYFNRPADRLLLAKRRLWRAIRGKIDIGLQTGTMDIETAASYLQKAGISKQQAVSSARKYPLNPGYQVCYTLGLRRFLALYDRYGQNNLQKFARTILDQGEIRFTDLETLL